MPSIILHDIEKQGQNIIVFKYFNIKYHLQVNGLKIFRVFKKFKPYPFTELKFEMIYFDYDKNGNLEFCCYISNEYKQKKWARFKSDEFGNLESYDDYSGNSWKKSWEVDIHYSLYNEILKTMMYHEAIIIPKIKNCLVK